MGTVITVQEVGIDWITATASGAQQSTRLVMLGERTIDMLVQADFKRKPWSKWGFYGETARYCSYGTKDDSAVIVVSGHLCNEVLDAVVERATNVSRIDLQVTVKTEPMYEGVAARLYEQFDAAGEGGRRGAVAEHRHTTDGGSTTYLGSRISDKFFRCYDKWRESADDAYKGCWRYEIEYKNAPALLVASRLAGNPERDSVIRATVHRHVVSHGGRPIFVAGGEGLLVPAPRPVTDLEHRCDWLAKTVSKSAQEVAVCLGKEALLRILGCDELSTSRSGQSGGGEHGHHSYESYPEVEV